MKDIKNLTSSELDGYAEAHGIDVSAAKTKAEKIEAIDKASYVEAIVMGVRARVRPDAADDFELLDWMDELNEGNGLLLPRIVKRLFGDEWPRVFEELKGDDPKLSIEKATEFFTKFFTAIDAKNA